MVAAIGSLTAASGIGAASGQLFEQRLGLLQVGGVKALGEPAVALSEQLAGFLGLALPLPQPSSAHYRPQLSRLRVLAAGQRERLGGRPS